MVPWFLNSRTGRSLRRDSVSKRPQAVKLAGVLAFFVAPAIMGIEIGIRGEL